MKPKIVIVGCGIVGAMVAYELSRQVSADIWVLDPKPPAQGSTGAALGVLMGVISHKVKGRNWQLREDSIRRYPSLIETLNEELAAQGQPIAFNRQGIVSLCFDEAQLPKWRALQAQRAAQGWPLEIWSPSDLQRRCPHITQTQASAADRSPPSRDHSINYLPGSLRAAIYSPADAQVNPGELTRALVTAASGRGVAFVQGAVTELCWQGQRCVGVNSGLNRFPADAVVLTAGLGSRELAPALRLMPVLGQAMEVELPQVLGEADFQPVITGHDIHLVPLGRGLGGWRYWLGATVEFPPDQALGELEPIAARLADLKAAATCFIPAIAEATVVRTWSGLRPRPVGQPAPVIGPFLQADQAPAENVMVATGHYRNGVLLAPATAQQVCAWLQNLDWQDFG